MPGADQLLEICHPNGFVEHNGRLFVLDGLAHLGDDDGSIIELVHEEGEWTGRTWATFDSQPNNAVFDTNGDMLVLTYKGIIRIDSGGKAAYITVKRWKQQCYTYSMATDGLYIYLGMRGGIMRYPLAVTGKAAWLRAR